MSLKDLAFSLMARGMLAGAVLPLYLVKHKRQAAEG